MQHDCGHLVDSEYLVAVKSSARCVHDLLYENVQQGTGEQPSRDGDRRTSLPLWARL